MKVREMEAVDYTFIRHELIPQVSGEEVVWSPDELQAAMDDRNFHPYVVESNEEIVAYAELHITWHPSRGCTGRIERVVVDVKHRGNGYATLVMKKLEEVATERGCAYLVLKTESDVAAGLYEKLNYDRQEESINYTKRLRPL